MARARAKAKAAASAAARDVVKTSTNNAAKTIATAPREQPAKSGWSETFSWLACATAHWTGKPMAFLLASAAVIVWAATGPLFNYSDTWQLVINTSTTIITFLMVFLIQNTQNRDTMALQLKLSELILVINEAENRVATAEDLSDEELERLHEELRARADNTLGALDSRRAARTRKAS